MERKDAQATGITAALRGSSSKGHSKMCGSFTKAEARVSASRASTHRRIQYRTWATTTVALLMSSHSTVKLSEVSYLGSENWSVAQRSVAQWSLSCLSLSGLSLI